MRKEVLMIRFEEKKLIIEIESHDPACTWIEIQQSLCDIIRNVTQENICDSTFYGAIDLLGALQPDWDDAKKMMQ